MLIDGLSLVSAAAQSVQYFLHVSNSPVPLTVRHSNLHPIASVAAIGVYVEDSNVTLMDNTITTSDASQGVEGVRATSSAGSHTLVMARNSVLTGNVGSGSNLNVYGVSVADASGTGAYLTFRAHDNVIVSGTSSASPGASIALKISGTGGEVRNNTLVSKGASQESSSVHYGGVSATALLSLDNNIMTAASSSSQRCFQFDDPARVASLYNNLGFNCPSDNYTNIATTGGNITGDPLFADTAANNYSLQSMSPAKAPAGRDGATNGWNFDGAYVDRAGTSRGTSWSIGAYQ
jgi:hypothetical protein